jgi:hypothetical protein
VLWRVTESPSWAEPPRCDSVRGSLSVIDAKPTLERCVMRPQEGMRPTRPPRDCHGERSGSLLVAKKVAVAKTSVPRRGDFLRTKSYKSDRPTLAVASLQSKNTFAPSGPHKCSSACATLLRTDRARAVKRHGKNPRRTGSRFASSAYAVCRSTWSHRIGRANASPLGGAGGWRQTTSLTHCLTHQRADSGGLSRI